MLRSFKPLLLACLTLATQPLIAAFNDGFYVGGLLGGDYVKECSSATFTIKDVGSDSHNYNDHYNGAKVGLLLGYMNSPCGPDGWLRIVPEVSMEAGRVRHTTSFITDGTHYKDRISLPWSFGLRMRVGVVFGFDKNESLVQLLGNILGSERHWFFYGLLGGVLSPIEWQRQNDGYPLAEQKKKALGMLFGIGLERELACGHRIGLELTRTNYQKQCFSSGDVDEISSHTYSARLELTALTLRYSIPF